MPVNGHMSDLTVPPDGKRFPRDPMFLHNPGNSLFQRLLGQIP